MAYAGGYVYGYQDGTDYLFTPTTPGYSIPIDNPTHGHSVPVQGFWQHYGPAIPVQTHIIYTSSASALVQSPPKATFDAADAGSGVGDSMIYPTPGEPYPITETEALAIIADVTYGDFVSQE